MNFLGSRTEQTEIRILYQCKAIIERIVSETAPTETHWLTPTQELATYAAHLMEEMGISWGMCVAREGNTLVLTWKTKQYTLVNKCLRQQQQGGRMNLYEIITAQSALIEALRNENKALGIILENSRRSLAAAGPSLNKARAARKKAEAELDRVEIATMKADILDGRTPQELQKECEGQFWPVHPADFLPEYAMVPCPPHNRVLVGVDLARKPDR